MGEESCTRLRRHAKLTSQGRATPRAPPSTLEKNTEDKPSLGDRGGYNPLKGGDHRLGHGEDSLVTADDERREDREDKKPARPSTGRALLWTAASIPLPGIAHLRMRRHIAGALILLVYLSGLAALFWWASQVGGTGSTALTAVAGMAMSSQWLLTAMGVVFAVTVLWLAIVVHSWSITRPEGSSFLRRFTGGFVVLCLCLTLAVPSALALHAGYTTYETINDVFSAPDDPDLPPHDAADPWNGAERVNVLLIGADSGDDRYGTRTDTMMVASVDTSTGDAVLVGLPRNLENVRFPEHTELAQRYPEPMGFDLLLNDIYQAVADEPGELAINPTVGDPAADTLKTVIGHNIGLDVEYYAMVDMMGFRDLIDAVGGVEIYIEEAIPYGVHGDQLEPGRQTLNGHDALWYGRSRIGTDDYGRMGRQGCLVKYVAEQIDPSTLLTSYRDLAGATQRTLSTDIPQSKVPAFLELAEALTADGSMSTLQLSPPQVSTANPDWEEIQELVAEALRSGAQEGDEIPVEPSEDPSDSPSGEETQEAEDGEEDERTEWQEYTGLAEPSPGDPGRQVGTEPTDLEALCP